MKRSIIFETPVHCRSHCQRANRDGVFTQRCKTNTRARREGIHGKVSESAGDGGTQRFAKLGKPPAKNNHRGMKQMNGVRKAEGEIFRCFAKNPSCRGIFSPQRGSEIFRLASGASNHHFAKQARRLACFESADFGVNRPTGAVRFDSRAGAVQSHMTDFRFAGCCAVVNSTVNYKPAAHAAAESDIKDRIRAGTRAVQRLAQSGYICIVVYENGRWYQPLKPPGQIKINPAFDLVGTADLSGLPIHRTAKADADSGRFGFGQNFFNRCFNLAAYSGCAQGRVHGKMPAQDDFCGGIANDDLQLRATDFDAEKNGAVFGHECMDEIQKRRKRELYFTRGVRKGIIRTQPPNSAKNNPVRCRIST